MREMCKRIWAEDRQKLTVSFISTFVFGLIAHAYGLLNNIFSHDSLDAIYADGSENLVKISVGRFLVPVIRTLRGPIAIPWLIGIIALVFIALSVYTVLKLFDVKSVPASVLIAGIMTTNVTVTAVIGTYVHEFDFDMLALLLSCIAVYLWRNARKITALIPAALIAAASMAIYQSYVQVTVTLIIMLLILDTLDGGDIKNVLTDGIKGAGTIAVGAGIYFVINSVLLKVFATAQLDRVNILGEYEESLFKRIFLMFKSVAVSFLSPAGVIPTVVIAVINAAVFALIAVLVIVAWKNGKLKAKSCVFTVFLFGLLLVGLNFVRVLSHDEAHDVMKYSFWFVYVFAVVLAVKYADFGKFCKAAAFVLTAVIVWNGVLVSNTAYLKKDLELTATLSAYNRIITDLEETDGYKVGETEIAFTGKLSVMKQSAAFRNVSHIIGLNNTTAAGSTAHTDYYNPYIAMFKYDLNYPIVISDKDFRDDSRVEKMPSYPQKGYIQFIDGVLVVKLGDKKEGNSGMSNIEYDLRRVKDFITE